MNRKTWVNKSNEIKVRELLHNYKINSNLYFGHGTHCSELSTTKLDII